MPRTFIKTGLAVAILFALANSQTTNKVEPSYCSGNIASEELTQFKENCYEYVNSPSTWSQAQQICKDAGGNLATVRSENQQKVLMKILRGEKPNVAWFGLSLVNNQWAWADDNPNLASWTAGDYSGWAAFQPSGVQETCAAFDSVDVLNNQEYNWHDYQCSESHPFICEFKVKQTFTLVSFTPRELTTCKTQQLEMQLQYKAVGPYDFKYYEVGRYDSASSADGKWVPVFRWYTTFKEEVLSSEYSNRITGGDHVQRNNQYTVRVIITQLSAKDTANWQIKTYFRLPDTKSVRVFETKRFGTSSTNLTVYEPPTTTYQLSACVTGLRQAKCVSTREKLFIKRGQISFGNPNSLVRLLCTKPINYGVPPVSQEVFIQDSSVNWDDRTGYIAQQLTIRDVLKYISKSAKKVTIGCELVGEATKCITDKTLVKRTITIKFASAPGLHSTPLLTIILAALFLGFCP